MDENNLVRIDGLKWWIRKLSNGVRIPQPLCPDHDLRLQPDPPSRRLGSGRYVSGHEDDAFNLVCAEDHILRLPRKFGAEKQYVIDRVDAKVFKGMKVIDLDGELTPIAKEKITSRDESRFLTAQLMESKRGTQIVVYAGKKGEAKKTQIFVEPEIKRLAFDQKDLHPSDVFAKIDVTFADGTMQSINQPPDASDT